MMPDGKVLYSADYDGVFNIYSLDLETQQISQLTREVGGAFEPHWQAESGLVYQSYDAKVTRYAKKSVWNRCAPLPWPMRKVSTTTLILLKRWRQK